MKTQYPHMFSPITIGGVTFKNRIWSAPAGAHLLYGKEGYPNDHVVAYYANKARGGSANITVSAQNMDIYQEYDNVHAHENIFDSENHRFWNHLTDAIHFYGAKASLELLGFSYHGRNYKGELVNYSVNGEEGTQILDKAAMESIASIYADAAENALKCGFDMILIHGGHGLILSQMLSPKFNTRTDEFGGSLENRAKFPLMVIAAVRKAVGPKVPIEYRIGPELIEGGLSVEEVVQFCQLIEDKVELIHVSAGLDTDPNFAVKTHPTMFLPHMPNVKYAAEVKKAVTKCPVVTVGSVVTPAEAEQVLEDGKADAVAMVRSLIADPFLPQKAREGHDEDIRPCLRCLDCLTGMQTKTKFACAVNPRTGHEFRLNAEEAAAPKTKKTVLIAGGGPGGLEAAATAAARGHQVILAEKSDSLGGLLKFTDYDSLKADLKRLKDHLIYRVEHSDVEIRLNTEVTPELVAEIKPDALFLALGSTPVVFPLPGIETAQHATTAYTNLDALGKTVAVMGGGLVGCETALFLAETGRDVTIIEMQNDVAPDANWMHRVGMLQSFAQQKNLHVRTGLRCMAVTGEGVETQDKDGNTVVIPAESKVYAFGQRSVAADKLMALDVPVIRIIGDCHQVGKTNGAIFDGYHAAMDL